MDFLYGYTFSKMLFKFETLGLTKLDAKRIYPWVYKKQTDSVESMSDVPLKAREIIQKNFSLDRLKCNKLLSSTDGTQKALLELSDGETIESVLIRDRKWITLCMSTQVGCAMKCEFCNTGTQQLKRNLNTAELVGQLLFWNDELKKSDEHITHIVVMGMGEPFMNYEHLSEWLEIILDARGIGISRHKITISTCGITDFLEDLGKKYKVQLAISLHAPNNEIRTRIMPINKKYCMQDIMAFAKRYPKFSNTDYVTFEYLMLKGINDSLENAEELCSILNGINCKVNLIMYNEYPGSTFKTSDYKQVELFQNYLKRRNIMCTLRKSKGKDILAACGQLKSEISHVMTY